MWEEEISVNFSLYVIICFMLMIKLCVFIDLEFWVKFFFLCVFKAPQFLMFSKAFWRWSLAWWLGWFLDFLFSIFQAVTR